MCVDEVGRQMLFMGKLMAADVKKEVQGVRFGRFVQLWHLNIWENVKLCLKEKLNKGHVEEIRWLWFLPSAILLF